MCFGYLLYHILREHVEKAFTRTNFEGKIKLPLISKGSLCLLISCKEINDMVPLNFKKKLFLIDWLLLQKRRIRDNLFLRDSVIKGCCSNSVTFLIGTVMVI